MANQKPPTKPGIETLSLTQALYLLTSLNIQCQHVIVHVNVIVQNRLSLCGGRDVTQHQAQAIFRGLTSIISMADIDLLATSVSLFNTTKSYVL